MLLKMVPRRFMEEHEKHMAFTRAKLSRRMEAGKERPDVVEGLLRKREEWGLTMEKLRANSSILIICVSETTATLLSGVTYFLLTNPDAMEKLRAEIRTAFGSEDESGLRGRRHAAAPPGPLGRGPPHVPPCALSVCRGSCPREARASAGISSQRMHFNEPFAYRPERWLGDPRSAGDNHDAFQPFHLGRNLAYIKMRPILARVFWNFDMKISDENRD
ncbi:hypothetical protein DL766_001026 [Monosporascus sp. MC13-8B]|uniref:Cytochrome P450 n=1 Tax=Monosporascus cannonballus TaxID=155416 RepID=A0ABY0H7V6_9PEZI|nr:hypothetical protein DL763_010670 [Monosporascus cannonballus]RYO86369.1 hypothetical protein DL762_004785 [Monosporascus cannonballus]RYP38317.1 hypothetical protein DL766_001026 [Monosporascus sp. MC13-8B]